MHGGEGFFVIRTGKQGGAGGMLVCRRGTRLSEEEVGEVDRRGGTKRRGAERESGTEATRMRYHKRMRSECDAVDAPVQATQSLAIDKAPLELRLRVLL